MVRHKKFAIGLALAAFLLVGSACNLDVFHDSISTVVEIPLQQYDEPVTATKRFKFERDVGAAKGAVLDRAWVAVASPSSLDLSFVSSVEVYAVDPDTGENVLLVTGGGFKSGETLKDMEVIYTDDVRSFVRDQRVNLEWHVRQNRLFRRWPTAELAELRFGIVLEIDTQ